MRSTVALLNGFLLSLLVHRIEGQGIGNVVRDRKSRFFFHIFKEILVIRKPLNQTM